MKVQEAIVVFLTLPPVSGVGMGIGITRQIYDKVFLRDGPGTVRKAILYVQGCHGQGKISGK